MFVHPPRVVHPPQTTYPQPEYRDPYGGRVIDGGTVIDGRVIRDGSVYSNEARGRVIGEPQFVYPADGAIQGTNLSEPPEWVAVPNQKKFRISCPKSEGATFAYELVSSNRTLSLKLRPGYRHTLTENEIWKIRYQGKNGTTTYRLRGGKDYVLQRKNGAWQVYRKPANPNPEPPVYGSNT